MIVGRPNLIPESAELDENDGDLRKRAKYLQRCKNAWWSRWSAEYLKALRERHNLKNKTTEMNVKPGDVVLIKGDERNRGRWKSWHRRQADKRQRRNCESSTIASW